ncbi:DUF4344 domain-containing metallopeptidase [Paragemmobacter ruber]|uniref:Metallopeptidase n=1 Tax=Paragemmobacter ruber TaxID=1985673 RepID=A0ABW9Y310_9RHOB|nr:DUF4344 domain-containing metallopeptidase [Rhodobacter ruber]NBE06521.1 hypothetical protein [Rhodobacter ruber]
MLRLIGSLVICLSLSCGAAAQSLGYKGPSGDGQGGEDDSLAGEELNLTDAEWYARDVMLTIFYHELGHALIDVMQLPVLGLEEDAADVLSVVMIDRLWDAESSEAKVAAAANFWWASAVETAEAGYEPAFWGVHSPDERRYFTYLCLYYGGAPEEREALAVDYGLPEDRAATCPDEFDLAAGSWGVYLDELEAAGPGDSLVWQGEGEPADYIEAAILEEVDYLNSVWTLPEPVGVQVAPCEEANAFYDPSEKMITMCSEMAEYILSTAPQE